MLATGACGTGEGEARVRIDGAATTISWIPSEAVTGMVYRVPFAVDVAHYDDPPPDRLPDVDAYLDADGARFANLLRAWIEVRDGEIVDYGHGGGGQIGSTTLRLGTRRLRFVAFALPDLQRAERLGPDAVRFEQTAGGRTGVPSPRRVAHAPYVQLTSPLAWSTVALTLHADGRQECELSGASPFPRHWLYDGDGMLTTRVRPSTTTRGAHRRSGGIRHGARSIRPPWSPRSRPRWSGNCRCRSCATARSHGCAGSRWARH